jgi:hypothetical protein
MAVVKVLEALALHPVDGDHQAEEPEQNRHPPNKRVPAGHSRLTL